MRNGNNMIYITVANRKETQNPKTRKQKVGNQKILGLCVDKLSGKPTINVKGNQIRQFLRIVEKYNLRLEDEE